MRLRGILLSGLVVGLLGTAAPANAALITGNLSISGAITYDTLNTVGGATLNFIEPFTSPPSAPTGPFIEVTSASGVLGTYGLGTGSKGSIENISNVPATPNTVFAPAGVDLTGTVNNFLQKWTKADGTTAIPGLHFDLTSIPIQSGPGCPTTPSCAEGPFLLTETTNGIRVSFDVFGNFVNGADFGAYKGSFSMVVDGLTLAEAGKRLTVTGQDIMCGINNLEKPCSFTANFDPVPAIPEPATILTFGLGSLALARIRRRKV